jgi:hypothetical protein
MVVLSASPILLLNPRLRSQRRERRDQEPDLGCDTLALLVQSLAPSMAGAAS